MDRRKSAHALGGVRRGSWLGTRAGRRLLGLGLLGLFGLYVALPGRRQSEPWVYPIGCSLVFADGACTPDEEAGAHLQLWVQTSKSAKVALLGDWFLPISARVLSTDSGQLLQLEEMPRGRSVLLLSRQGWSVRWHSVTLRSLAIPDWLQTAWRTWLDGADAGGRRTREQLQQHAADGTRLTGQAQARFLNLQARLAQEDKRSDLTERLEEAIAASQRAGLMSDEAELVLILSEELSASLAKIGAAEALLAAHRDAFARLPEWKPWEARQQALHQFLRGDLRGALERLAHGRQIAQRTSNLAGRADIDKLAAELLSRLGRVREASKLLAALDVSPLHPCLQIEKLFAEVEVGLQARLIQPERSLAGILGEPGSLLDQALALERRCDKQEIRARVYAYRARAALQDKDYAQALAIVAEAESLGGAQVPEFASTWVAVRGESALGQKDWEGARASFRKLRQLARLRLMHEGDLRESARSRSRWDQEWQALIGLAQIAEHDQELDARAQSPQLLYREAERLADRESFAAPLGLGRGGYLGRYERGTGLYVKWLVEHKELAEALRAMRHARLRGILALAALLRSPSSRDSDAAAYRDARASYVQMQATINEIARQMETAPQDELPGLQAERERLDEQALQTVERALGQSGEHAVLMPTPDRPLATGQALLTCYPTGERWVCLGADADGIAAIAVAGSDLAPTTAPARLTQVLLLPFAQKLERAQQLFVIAYGALRQIDVHMLPFGPQAQPLGMQRDVLYALDLPGSRKEPAQPPAAPRIAYLLFDPLERFPAIHGISATIIAAVEKAGYMVTAQVGGAVPRGGPQGQIVSSANLLTSDKLRSELARATLFHAGAHIDYYDHGSGYPVLPLSEDPGLRIDDILFLPHVPRFVTLFGCETGRSTEQWGNLEGLGLATAFLARGSEWVVGTSRPVGAPLTAAVSTSFYGEFARDPNPVTALRAAVARSQAVPASAAPDRPGHSDDSPGSRDVGAFRIYVP